MQIRPLICKSHWGTWDRNTDVHRIMACVGFDCSSLQSLKYTAFVPHLVWRRQLSSIRPARSNLHSCLWSALKGHYKILAWNQTSQHVIYLFVPEEFVEFLPYWIILASFLKINKDLIMDSQFGSIGLYVYPYASTTLSWLLQLQNMFWNQEM